MAGDTTALRAAPAYSAIRPAERSNSTTRMRGIADNGVPTGLQIVGRTFDDATTFRVGAALERERPWLNAPERRPLQS